jgi:hypothetical protein
VHAFSSVRMNAHGFWPTGVSLRDRMHAKTPTPEEMFDVAVRSSQYPRDARMMVGLQATAQC